MKKKNGGSIWFFVGVLLLILLASFLFDSGTSQEKLTYSTVLTHFREGMVNAFVIEGNNLSYTLKEDPDHPVTVSYTHLDVYKRQAVYCSATMCSARAITTRITKRRSRPSG